MSEKGRKKKEITVLLNQILGTTIAWHKLSMDELEQVVNLFTNPDELYVKLKALSKPEKEEVSKIRETIREVAMKVGTKMLEKWDGPIITYLRELLK